MALRSSGPKRPLRETCAGLPSGHAERVLAPLEQCEAISPALVLLDMRLPDIDGLEVSRQMRADQTLAHAKILAVSAAVFPADVAAALASGCDVFLQKPCLPDALVAEIERLLEPAVT